MFIPEIVSRTCSLDQLFISLILGLSHPLPSLSVYISPSPHRCWARPASYVTLLWPNQGPDNFLYFCYQCWDKSNSKGDTYFRIMKLLMFMSMLHYWKNDIFQKKYVCNWIHFQGGWPNIICPTHFHQNDEMKNMIEGQVGIEFIWLKQCEHSILKIAFVWKLLSFCLCVHEYTFKEPALWIWAFILKRLPDLYSFHVSCKIRKERKKENPGRIPFYSTSSHAEFLYIKSSFLFC